MGDSTNPYIVQPVPTLESEEDWTRRRTAQIKNRFKRGEDEIVKGGRIIYPGTEFAQFIPDRINPFTLRGHGNLGSDISKGSKAREQLLKEGKTPARPAGTSGRKADAIRGYAEKFIKKRAGAEQGELPFRESDISPWHSNKMLDSVIGNYISLDMIKSAVREIDRQTLEQSELGQKLENLRIPLVDKDGNLTGKYRKVQHGDNAPLLTRITNQAEAIAANKKIINNKIEAAIAKARGGVTQAVSTRIDALPDEYRQLQDRTWDREQILRKEAADVKTELIRLRERKEARLEEIELARTREENDMLKHRELLEADQERYDDQRRERRKDRNFGAVGQGIEALMLLFGGL